MNNEQGRELINLSVEFPFLTTHNLGATLISYALAGMQRVTNDLVAHEQRTGQGTDKFIHGTSVSGYAQLRCHLSYALLGTHIFMRSLVISWYCASVTADIAPYTVLLSKFYTTTKDSLNSCTLGTPHNCPHVCCSKLPCD